MSDPICRKILESLDCFDLTVEQNIIKKIKCAFITLLKDQIQRLRDEESSWRKFTRASTGGKKDGQSAADASEAGSSGGGPVGEKSTNRTAEYGAIGGALGDKCADRAAALSGVCAVGGSAPGGVCAVDGSVPGGVGALGGSAPGGIYAVGGGGALGGSTPGGGGAPGGRTPGGGGALQTTNGFQIVLPQEYTCLSNGIKVLLLIFVLWLVLLGTGYFSLKICNCFPKKYCLPGTRYVPY